MIVVTDFLSILESKGKLSPRSYAIHFERKWKYSFLTLRQKYQKSQESSGGLSWITNVNPGPSKGWHTLSYDVSAQKWKPVWDIYLGFLIFVIDRWLCKLIGRILLENWLIGRMKNQFFWVMADCIYNLYLQEGWHTLLPKRWHTLSCEVSACKLKPAWDIYRFNLIFLAQPHFLHSAYPLVLESLGRYPLGIGLD